VRDSENAVPDPNLGARLRLIREEVYGPNGIISLAHALGLSAETWKSYEETGDFVPAQVLLRFIELTGADPLWLLSGKGDRYRAGTRRMPHRTDHNTNGTAEV